MKSNVILFRHFGAVFSGAWIVLVLVLLGLNLYARYEQPKLKALEQAQESLRKDLVYRHWNAQHGGVYVEVSEHAQPNPYLEGLVENRDVITDDGRKLTLINPAYMTRQAHEVGRVVYGLEGHITSLNVIRPGNEPDEWEARALQQFENGVEQVAELTLLQGEEHLRLMKPLFADEACLGCHRQQGYEAGDLRGGLSVSIPMKPYWQAYREMMAWSVASFAVILVLGLIGIHYGQRALRRYLRQRDDAMTHLEREERRNRARVAGTPAMVCEFLPGGEITFVNQAYGEQFDRSPDSLVGTNFQEWIPAESREAVMSNIGMLTPENPTLEHEHPVVLPDGETGWQRWVNRGVFNDQGEIEYYHSLGTDVTEWKRREQRLAQLNAVLDQSPDGVIVTDLEGRIDYVNDAFTRISGYGAAELKGQDASILKSGETPEVTYKEIWNALSLGMTWKGVISNRRKDGSTYEVMARFTAIRNQHGQILNYLSMQSDLTRDREIQDKLSAQVEELSRWQDLTLNREDRISELKREVNRLLEDSGLSPKYASEPTDPNPGGTEDGENRL